MSPRTPIKLKPSSSEERPRKSEHDEIEERLLKGLAELGGQRISTDDIIFEGSRIVLPSTMDLATAQRYLADYETSQESEHSFSRQFPYRPWDGAHALMKACEKLFGTLGIQQATYSFFGGKRPPQLRSIPVGFDQTAQVPWGEISLPIFKGTLYTGAIEDPELGELFILSIETARKYSAHVEGLFTAVAQELRDHSIYRGHAINGRAMPEFLDLRGVNPDKVIYSAEMMMQLRANVWSLLECTDQMRALGLPLKRSVVFGGPYGTGKTLAAFLTAQIAVANGWTFIYCRPKDDLATVMGTARLYPPAVVFFEDVDTVADGSIDRPTELLDLFDGITAKGTELVCILTTNHPERIHQGMLRPGRLDCVLRFGALDPAGIERLIHALVPAHLLLDDLDIEAISLAMHGYVPAFVTEAINRAMRYAIARTDGEPDSLSTEDFILAADGLRAQLELMEQAEAGRGTPQLVEAFRGLVTDAIASEIDVQYQGDAIGTLVRHGNGSQ